MSSPGVSLLRRALLPVLVARVVAPGAALAATDGGGAPLPGGAQASAPATPATDSSAGGSIDPVTEAAQVSIAAPVPPVTALPAAGRLPTDPLVTDVAALVTPSAIAAVDGHAVIVRVHMGHSELVDLIDPASPRVLLTSTRDFGVPNGGHDAEGRPVVVVSPCAGTEEVVQLGEVPRCPLRSVDLTDGTDRALPATTGALQGDLAGARLVFTRASPTAGVRLYESTGAAATPAVLPNVATPAGGWTRMMGKPSLTSVVAGGLDVDAAGRVAVVLEHRSRVPVYSSALWERSAAGAWRRQATVGTMVAGMGSRHVLGPQLDSGGVRAYVEGVVESPSFLGRWTDAGAQTTKASIRRSIGRATIANSATFDGNRFLLLDWLPGAPCGSEGAHACGLRAVSPVPIP